ncbi:hypothetical protein [Caniella muris]|uniref:hypothetical protein n=1 Tax=Caniella muris TaxID=2941502 RepID=UPI00203ABA9C|nr:hypothetical protein [Caniella muris]
MNRNANADPVTDLAQALHEAGEELRRLGADAAADRCTAVLARWTLDAAGGVEPRAAPSRTRGRWTS